MYYLKSIIETCEELNTVQSTGLSQEEAKKRLLSDGPNALVEKKGKTKLQMFLAQLKDTLIYILFAAAAISIALNEITDAIIILLVVLLNAVIGMVQESKAEAALEALKNLSSPNAMVRREGRVMEIPAGELVVGDVVILEAGRIIPADLRLIQSVNLKIEESALTGESVPVDKNAELVTDKEVGIGDRLNMAFSSTSVSYGRGEGVVVYTGMDTEIGKIAAMINESTEELTPLQKRLNDLGKVLGIVAVVIVVAMFGIAVLQGRDIIEMFITAIALAVAAVPEGLTAVVTIVLALGVTRMVKVNTIVRKLPAVETLGAVSIVCSDKTGTLTQNKMTVTKVYLDGEIKDTDDLSYENNKLFLDGFILCNDASTANNTRIGDPTELALLDMGDKINISREGLEETNPRINEQSFDSARKLMTTVHKDQSGKVMSYTKGAMDILLKRCNKVYINGETIDINDIHIENINKAASEMAKGALRVLALGIKEDDDSASEEALTFVGLVGMIDPPRPEAKASVKTLKKAGIRTIMITGDHKDTALAIAKELGIAEDEAQCITGTELNELTQEQLNERVCDIRVFARVSPEHKVMIVKAFKSNGSIVSMTGDGVNDAPSLKAADIGVAMGITGTDVAKGASDMVLTDDNFATIEKAVAEGRGIYGNIKKTVLFLLSSNFGEVISMFSAIAAGLIAPLQSIHILWVNLITDSLPALALGVDPKSRDIMNEKPRDPNESLFAHGGLAFTFYNGIMIAALTLGAFLWSPVIHLNEAGIPATLGNIRDLFNGVLVIKDADLPDIIRHAQTYAFTTLGVSQLFHAIGMRNYDKSLFQISHTDNLAMIGAFTGGLLLQILVTEIPFLTEVFETSQLSLREWINLILLSMVPLLSHEIIVMGKKIFKK
ncbi:MAG: cation-translocating P-type ATPase [Tissierellia bacterium]|nr:cation-translocating P-type ATPase [Tissierellia bacterium]MDD3750896.1 cation-translocating P-type ATPase [Tissierellia bacterium]MDD4046034.1 cation-translocating P-type ATPase [Tissierellia bacterium]MDD4677893.1 cation-translocating P-type ATPase [Tissierellia bacterium]